jgi:hypothetical protein
VAGNLSKNSNQINCIFNYGPKPWLSGKIFENLFFAVFGQKIMLVAHSWKYNLSALNFYLSFQSLWAKIIEVWLKVCEINQWILEIPKGLHYGSISWKMTPILKKINFGQNLLETTHSVIFLIN